MHSWLKNVPKKARFQEKRAFFMCRVCNIKKDTKIYDIS